MSLSEMSRATYRKHRKLLRSNGNFAFKWIECPLEREDMRQLYADSLEGDLLVERAYFHRFDSPAVAFRLTHTL